MACIVKAHIVMACRNEVPTPAQGEFAHVLSRFLSERGCLLPVGDSVMSGVLQAVSHDHNSLGHDYTGHNYIGHTYII